MAKAPAYQNYASDFMAKTISWDAIEVGIYVRLRNAQWVNGGLPNEDVRLAKIAGVDTETFQKAWVIVGFEFALCPDGLIREQEIENLRAQKQAFAERQSVNGKKGGRPPKKTQPEPNENPTLLQKETQMESQKNPLEVEVEVEKENKEGGTGETEEQFFIGRAFNDIWLETMTDYLPDESKDFPALRSIAMTLCKRHRLRDDNPTRQYYAPALDDWGRMVAHIAGNKHFSGYNLAQVEKYIQSIGQSLANAEKNKPDPTVKQSVLQTNYAEAQKAKEMLNKILNPQE